jgi:hypothetical protein
MCYSVLLVCRFSGVVTMTKVRRAPAPRGEWWGCKRLSVSRSLSAVKGDGCHLCMEEVINAIFAAVLTTPPLGPRRLTRSFRPAHNCKGVLLLQAQPKGLAAAPTNRASPVAMPKQSKTAWGMLDGFRPPLVPTRRDAHLASPLPGCSPAVQGSPLPRWVLRHADSSPAGYGSVQFGVCRSHHRRTTT